MTERNDVPAVGMLLEQTLGHVDHTRNLRNALIDNDMAELRCRDIRYEPVGRLDRFPPRSNWTVRAEPAAREAARDHWRDTPLDALFVPTPVPATFLGSAMNEVPTIISIDTTRDRHARGVLRPSRAPPPGGLAGHVIPMGGRSTITPRRYLPAW